MKKYISEFIGTLILVLFGTGVASITNGNIIITSIAFGLSIIVSSYMIGNISGCHINPAVSLAMFLTKKINKEDFAWYVVSQVLGAIAGTTILYTILSNTDLGTVSLGANYYGTLSYANTSLLGAIITETLLTFIFVYTILIITNDKTKTNISGIIIGFTLMLVHLIGIPLTGTSVNPARSLAPAIFVGNEAIKQVWVFILFPLLGATLSTFLYKYLNKEEKKSKSK